jgi:hypothetical protein
MIHYDYVPRTHVSLHLKDSQWFWTSGAQNIKGWLPWPGSDKTNLTFATAESPHTFKGSDERTLATILCESKNNYFKYLNAPLDFYMFYKLILCFSPPSGIPKLFS